MNNNDLVVVAGPTASGKTAVAIELAKRLSGEIISADSMQIYKGVPIATAAPTMEEKAQAAHHLVEFLDISQAFSVADFATLAREKITQIRQRGNLPIIAGGTGLYINSVINNIDFTQIKSDENLRLELTQKANELGGQALLEELMEFDPELAKTLHPNNVPRIIRAIEVYKLTGVNMTTHQINSRKKPSEYNLKYIGLTYHDRQKLYDRINYRVDLMLEAGLVEEAREFLSKNNTKTAMQAIGYKELKPYFDGVVTLEQAVDRIKQESRRYAKRQLTWFRRDERINWIYIDQCQSQQEVFDKAEQIARN